MSRFTRRINDLFAPALRVAAGGSILVTFAVARADWPQFLGPTRDGIYAGPELARTWPKEGPRVAWQRSVGAGFAGPVVSGGKLILFHRVGDRETVECLDAATGKESWKVDY